MTKTFLNKIKEQLLSQKREILNQVEREIVIDTDGDETDEIQGNMLIELTNQLNSRNSAKLAQIESALERIADNSYGLCLDCNDPILEKRLLINPYFQTCISCAEEREVEEKQRKKL
ncbi:MAG TPA: TraR/DksA C4-type zinc finger protein [Candidatus Saccharimonadales bacterium]